jgi:hypothetical protein
MENNQIEFYSPEESKKRLEGKNHTFVFSLGMFFVAIIIFSLLSFFSIRSAMECVKNSKNQASFSDQTNRNLNIPGSDYNVSKKGAEQFFLAQCLKGSILAKNALNILALSINFVIIFILALLYQILFNKGEKSVKMGRAVIIALILSVMYLFPLLFGIFGMIIALIGGIWMLKIILGTDIIGAIFFIILLFVFNSIVNHLLAKLLVG